MSCLVVLHALAQAAAVEAAIRPRVRVNQNPHPLEFWC